MIKIVCFTLVIIILFSFIYKNMYKTTNESYKNPNTQPIQKIKAKNSYDAFYAPVYSTLVSDQIIQRSKFEVDDLIDKTKIKEYTKVNLLDIGCGGGDHLRWLSDENLDHLDLVGIDKSEPMLLETKKRIGTREHPVRLVKKDVLENDLFMRSSFSHIVCYYFTIYFIDTKKLMKNITKWLKPKGWFVVHMVDLENFDPVLDASSPFLGINPQKYVKNRITESKVYFKKFIYNSRFILKKNKAYYLEKFKFKNKPIERIQKQILQKLDMNDFVDKMGTYGLELKQTTNLKGNGYHYQYILYFQKS